MNKKLFFILPLLCALTAFTSAGAQSSTVLHGVVTDPTGAIIPGTSITLSTAAGAPVKTIAAGADGGFRFVLPVGGNFRLSAQTSGFADFTSPSISIATGQSRLVNITLAIEASKQVVVVNDDTPQISTAADQNASAIVLKEKDMDALSDDPDELSNELQALAGPSAGPNGGQIYIDGFTGGQLPPKSSIREIRINQNPYSAEFDRVGFGRIEILTKPGTDKLHAQFQAMGNLKALNTGNPYVAIGIPDYYSDQLNGSVSGSITKSSSFSFNIEHRTIQNANPYILFLTGYNSADTSETASGALFNPNGRWNISPRIDLQFGAKNTLTLRYQWEHSEASGSVGSTSSTSRATASHSTEHTAQIIDTQIVNDKIVTETRFQYRRARSNTHDTPTALPAGVLSQLQTSLGSQIGSGSTTYYDALAPLFSNLTLSAPTIGISSFFGAGPSNTQSTGDHQDAFELQNITTIAGGAHTVKVGTRLRDWRDANNTYTGFNGSFNFPSLSAYLATIGASGSQSYQASQFSYSAGNPKAVYNLFDGALFVQDDWKVSPVLTVSPGFRFEGQNHIGDHADYGPRIALAWALDGSAKQQAKTVLRAGFGYFFERNTLGYLGNTHHYLGSSPAGIRQYTIDNPQCFSGTSATNSTFLQSCGISTAVPNTYSISRNYQAPADQQLGISLERQLTKTSTLSLTYLHTYGVHDDGLANMNLAGNSFGQSISHNSNVGNQYTYISEGWFKQQQLLMNLRAQLGQNFNLTAYYQFAHSRGDINGNPTNPYNLQQDAGRSNFNMANLAVVVANWTAPLGIRLSNFLFTHSGSPYNVVLATDINGDGLLNDRPTYGTSGKTGDTNVQTQFGLLNITPQSGETLLPVNIGVGPAFVADNIRVAKTFGFGPPADGESGGNNGKRNQQGGPNGPPPGGMRMGGGPGGGRGGPGGMFGAAGNTGRKYNLTFSVQALNAFNDINAGSPSGTLTASGGNFGRSTALSTSFGSNNVAARRIMLQTIFSF